MKSSIKIISRVLFKASLILIALLAGFPLHALAADLLLKPRGEREFLIIAHRGANKFAPENTLPAIEKAIELGVDFVEIDVRTTKDGKLVLMHNADVNGATNGKGMVRDLAFGEIRKMDAGIRMGEKFRGVFVPTLEETLAAAKGRVNIYLDWKDADANALAAALDKAGMLDSTLVYGGAGELLLLQKINPKIRPMPQVDTIEQFKMLLASGLKFDVAAASWPSFSKELADAIHAAGKVVFLDILAEADSCAGFIKAMKKGADAVQTDRPDVILKCSAPDKSK